MHDRIRRDWVVSEKLASILCSTHSFCTTVFCLRIWSQPAFQDVSNIRNLQQLCQGNILEPFIYILFYQFMKSANYKLIMWSIIQIKEDTVVSLAWRPQLGATPDALSSSSCSSSSLWSSRSSMSRLDPSANAAIKLVCSSDGSSDWLACRCWHTLCKMLHKAFRAPESSVTCGSSPIRCVIIFPPGGQKLKFREHSSLRNKSLAGQR